MTIDDFEVELLRRIESIRRIEKIASEVGDDDVQREMFCRRDALEGLQSLIPKLRASEIKEVQGHLLNPTMRIWSSTHYSWFDLDDRSFLAPYKPYLAKLKPETEPTQ